MSSTPETFLGRSSAVPARADRGGTEYVLAVPDSASARLARAWLWLGMASLIGSGVFSVLLVLSRTPMVNQWLPVADYFRVALVLHVDLSVLVWFASLAGLLWSINGSKRAQPMAWIALGLCSLGAASMAIAALVAPGEPLMVNYVPVLDGTMFLSGLLAFAAGFGLLVLRSLLAALPLGSSPGGSDALRFGLYASAICAAVALLALVWSYVVIPDSLTGKAYFEVLFWGAGHALQFAWTLLMLVAWLWLASACGAKVPLTPRVTLLMFALAVASVFITPYAYFAHDIASVEHRNLHTLAMRFGGGVAILPIALAVVVSLLQLKRLSPTARPLRSALVASIVLFAAGGLIGILISGNNVKVPAHYHGCIVGVTLALMGVVYLLLPQLGLSAPQGRLATMQPAIYGAGQLMHITGLVWSGGYGVQRKVAGTEQVLRSTAEVAGMGLMGLGGLIAIVGGLLFVVVVIRAMRPSWRAETRLRGAS